MQKGNATSKNSPLDPEAAGHGTGGAVRSRPGRAARAKSCHRCVVLLGSPGRSVAPRSYRDVHPTAWFQLASLPDAQREFMEAFFASLGADDAQGWVDTLLGIRPGTHEAAGEAP